MRPTDGGGGRVLINPADLRRGAKRLRDVSADLKTTAGRLRGAPTPETAPPADGVPQSVHELGGTLDALIQPLTQSAVELDRRALWAEIADELAAGYPLTAAQMAEFTAALKDGTLVRYAEPWQAELAGRWLGQQYRSRFTDPEKLRELVGIMKANGGTYDDAHGAFFAGFIGSFGPENVAHMSRVIQAMEWPRLWYEAGSPYSDPYYDDDLMRHYDEEGFQLSDGDAKDFLLTFGMAMSVATYTGQLTRYAPGAERTIAFDEDSWGVAQLLNYEGTFGATFLRDVFQSGVIAQIGRHAGEMFESPVSRAPIGANDGFPTDQARLILDALERNPHAVALALSDPVPKEFQISYLLEGNSNPIAILYDHMNWDDDGQEFARLYQTGIDWCYQNGDDVRAYGMTASLVDSTIHSQWRTLDPMTDVLARDVADHHMPDLFLSATGAYPGGTAEDYKAGFVGPLEVNGVSGLHLILDKGELTDVVRTMAGRSEADEIFLHGARDYQAELIRQNTTTPAIPGTTDLTWATKLGDFDGIVMNAHDLDAADDFDKSNLAHQVFFKFMETTIGVVAEGHPIAGAGADLIVSGIDDATKPSFDALLQSTDDEKELLISTTHAAIAAGYYENGVLGSAGAPPADVLVDGRLASFTDLKDVDRMRQYLIWVNTNSEIDKVAGEAFDRVDQARDNRVLPAVPHG